MRQCPECERAFDDGLETCPEDGARLLPPDPLVGHTIDAKYRIGALVGRGGMGAVYRAVQARLERPVAIKVIRPDALAGESTIERFRREAFALARIKHPNIVVVHDFGVDETAGVYLVMELLAGRSLAEELERRGTLPPADALDVVAQVASAVHAAHAEGVIHRDLKPANILLEPSADRLVAKVLDFGVVRLQEPTEADSANLTVTGVILGTPSYMSPEQCEGAPLDARSDVYALGCVLYEALTGRPPFRATSLVALLQKHAYEAPEPPSARAAALPAEVDAIVLRALAKRPEQRFATALDLERALEAAARHLGPSAGGETTVAAARPAALGNLPVAMTSFVGRRREIAAIRDRLATARLVTLRGIGGMGKTRLGVEAARAAAADFEGGAWFVELAPLKDASLLPAAVAGALGVRETAGRPPVATLREAIGSKRLLLVLDNCEHLVAACAELVGTLLAACPGLSVLATSRETLGTPGEAVVQVAPLSVPRREDDVEGQADAEAVRLFLDRVRLHNPRFEPAGERWAAIAALCLRLEGIPLAIELAAARARVLSIDQILARLDDRFQLLRGSERPSMHRQQTLRAAIDWSYDLLSDEERALLARLSVFVGGCSLEAVEAVCSGGPIAPEDVLDLLARLADRSLIQVEERRDEARYSMLETIRQYGLERLRASGEDAELRARHRDWFVALADEADAHFAGPHEPEWHARIDGEYENFRALLRRFARDGGDVGPVARLCCILTRFWELYGHVNEGFSWLEMLAARDAEVSDQVVRCRLLRMTGWLARALGHHAASMDLLERAVAVARASGDTNGEARALAIVSIAVQLEGRFDLALECAKRSLELAEATGSELEMRNALNLIGLLALDHGDCEAARGYFARSLELAERENDKRTICIVLANLAVAAWQLGDLAEAERRANEARARGLELGDRVALARIWLVLGGVATLRLNPEYALECIREALTEAQALGNPTIVVNALEQMSGALVQLGLARDALRLVGAAETARAALTLLLPPGQKVVLERFVAAARADLDGEEADLALDEGRAMSLDDAVRLAVAAPTYS